MHCGLYDKIRNYDNIQASVHVNVGVIKYFQRSIFENYLIAIALRRILHFHDTCMLFLCHICIKFDIGYR